MSPRHDVVGLPGRTAAPDRLPKPPLAVLKAYDISPIESQQRRLDVPQNDPWDWQKYVKSHWTIPIDK